MVMYTISCECKCFFLELSELFDFLFDLFPSMNSYRATSDLMAELKSSWYFLKTVTSLIALRFTLFCLLFIDKFQAQFFCSIHLASPDYSYIYPIQFLDTCVIKGPQNRPFIYERL